MISNDKNPEDAAIPPAGWRIFSLSPEDNGILKECTSKCTWRVAAVEDRLEISADRHQRRSKDNLVTFPYAGGFLIGSNHGEEGGALWWMSAENVRAAHLTKLR